ncbi:MAG: hypothetical protein EAX96_10545 [Candidatus Lokiarchaeota archaeon]|nr:hypothetical protein [Candidatus Lokiarchaeota archaeon]
MDYIIELTYPRTLETKKKSNFSTRFGRLGNFKIRRGQYLVDREEILEKIKKLTSEFDIGLNITEYKELPNSLKKLIEENSKKIEIKEDIMKKFEILKKSFNLFYKVYLNLLEDPSIDTILKEFEKIEKEKQLIIKATSISMEE